MVSLAEQTEDTFGPKPIGIPQMGLPAPLPDPYSPEIKNYVSRYLQKIYQEHCLE